MMIPCSSSILIPHVLKAFVADFLFSVHCGGETFETVAREVPCANDGIPTEAAFDRLRASADEIKARIERL